MSKCKLNRPVVSSHEQMAYEVVSLRRSAEPGLMLDDYIYECAVYVAKRVLITISDKLEDAPRDVQTTQRRIPITLHVNGNAELGDGNVCVINWEHPVFSELNGEINIANAYGYLFARGVTYFYYEWFEALINAFESLLDCSAEIDEDNENHYTWDITVKQ